MDKDPPWGQQVVTPPETPVKSKDLRRLIEHLKGDSAKKPDASPAGGTPPPSPPPAPGA